MQELRKKEAPLAAEFSRLRVSGSRARHGVRVQYTAGTAGSAQTASVSVQYTAGTVHRWSGGVLTLGASVKLWLPGHMGYLGRR